MDIYPSPPKLFYCQKCKVYFYSYSRLSKPTHVRCKGHNTRLADEKEKQYIEKVNGN